MQYQPFLPEVASGTIDPRAVVVPLRTVLRHCEIVIGEVERVDHEARRATRPARGRAPARDRLRRRRAHARIDARACSRSRGWPSTGSGSRRSRRRSTSATACCPSSTSPRRPTTRTLAAPRSPSCSWAAGTRAWRRSASSRTSPATRWRPTRPCGPRRCGGCSSTRRRKILPELGEELADYASERLALRGVEIAVSTRLDSSWRASSRSPTGRSFRAETLVWTAGVRPSPLARGLRACPSTRRAAFGPTSSCAGRASTTRGRPATRRPFPIARPAGSCRRPRSTGCGRAGALGEERHGLARGRAAGAVRLPQHRGRVLARSLQGRRDDPGAAARGGSRRGSPTARTTCYAMPTLTRRVKIAADWTVALLFPRDLAQLGSLEHPRAPFERAAGRRAAYDPRWLISRGRRQRRVAPLEVGQLVARR